MMLPAFITFTGVDERTDIAGMLALRKLYPIEWGVLFSPKKQGEHPRYPALSFVNTLLRSYPHELAAHVCGGHSRAILDRGDCGLEDDYLIAFGRAQINGAPESSSHAIWHWYTDLGLRQVILQCRERFPDDPYANWLFDASGGKGIAPAVWPAPPDRIRAQQWGFAGGLNPGNVAAAVATIGAFGCDYWIDMESGVRDESDHLDLAKCHAVCEAVYGSRA